MSCLPTHRLLSQQVEEERKNFKKEVNKKKIELEQIERGDLCLDSLAPYELGVLAPST